MDRLKFLCLWMMMTPLFSVSSAIELISHDYMKVTQMRSGSKRMELTVHHSGSGKAPDVITFINKGETLETRSISTDPLSVSVGSPETEVISVDEKRAPSTVNNSNFVDGGFENALLEQRGVQYDSDGSRNLEEVANQFDSVSSGGGGGGCLLRLETRGVR